MNHSMIRHQLISKVRVSLIFCCISWVVLLERGALVLRGQTSNAHYDVLAGPLLLNRLTSEKQGEGISVHFSFEAGLIWFALFWLIVGILWAVFLTYLHARVNKHTNR